MGNTQYLNTRFIKEGIIESLPSKLKEVYNQYLSVLEDGQPDIVQDNWSDQRMSEKSLIDYMQRRIVGRG